MESYTDADIVVHHITALIGDDKANWYIGRRLGERIPVDELQSLQQLVYYPCNWETAEQAYTFMVNEYEIGPDLWWSANSGALIYLYKIFAL